MSKRGRKRRARKKGSANHGTLISTRQWDGPRAVTVWAVACPVWASTSVLVCTAVGSFARTGPSLSP